MASDLQVHVDGELFFVNEEILSRFCKKITHFSNEFSVKVPSKTKGIVLDGFPGGSEVFELIVKLCYKYGKVQITPSNTCILRLAAHFMEMPKELPMPLNLMKRTETSLDEISNWTNSELLIALRQCRDYFLVSDSCGVFEKVLKSVVERINSASESIQSDSSPESSRFRFSFETRSITSTKNSANCCSCKHWWLEDLAMFDVEAIEKIVHLMVSHKLEHSLISKFLFYYLKTRCSASTLDEKIKIIETVIQLLSSLESNSISCKGLFEVLRLSSSLNLSRDTRDALDNMIGCILDQATLDNMLIHAPSKIGTLYDVDQVVRFLKSFLQRSNCASLTQMKKVAILMDLYLAEAAPDPGLKPRKFVSLAMALPNAARDSFDGVYRALDIYIELHPDLLEEEKIMICCSLDYEKLSSEACKHLVRNDKMPSWMILKALMSQQSKLRGLLQKCYNSSCAKEESFLDKEQTVLYAKRISISAENEKLKDRLQGMQCKVMELEDAREKMQTQMRSMENATTVVVTRKRTSKFLPMLCS